MFSKIFQKAIAIAVASRVIIITEAFRKGRKMNTPVTINKLSGQTGLTSRTLRYWEEEGLFKSGRDSESGWRTYDGEAVLRVKLTALLRKFDIPVKDIKTVLTDKTYRQMHNVVSKRISELSAQRSVSLRQENQLKAFLSLLREKSHLPIETLTFDNIETEEIVMSNFKIVVLPAMRAVCNIAVGQSPEEDAMNPVFDWIKPSGLSGTARYFGFNTEPWPKGNQPYGYGMCAVIPEGTPIPPRFKEMRIEGGLYMALESGDDIGGSWQKLTKSLSADEVFEADKTRPCLEEHIAAMKPDGSGEGFCVTLLEPVKRK